MNITPYAVFQLILSFLALQLVIFQTFIYFKQKDPVYIWSIFIGALLFIFCAVEFHITRSAYPIFGKFLTKVQHSAITLYPLSVAVFWTVFLKEQKLRRLAKVFLGISIVCLGGIWLTDWHMSGEYTLKTLNKGTFFRIALWDYTAIGPIALLEMLFVIVSFIIIIIYLFTIKSKYLHHEKYYFATAYFLNLLCMVNDICVWTESYQMFQIIGLGNLLILTSIVYILSIKHYKLFQEAKRLNLQLDQTVKERTHELQDLNTHLEERVQERIEDLMKKEAQIAQTSKMESLGLLATGIAHDMNNMLMGITGNLQVLQEQEEKNSSVKDGHFTKALNSCAKAKELVKRLNTFSIQRSTSLHLENISDIIHLSLMIFKGSSKFLDIEIHEPKESVCVYIESASFMSLLLNLFINAHDAMEGRGTISISYSRDTFPNPDFPRNIPKQEYMHLAVKDTGSGIEKEAVEKIWSPFFTTKKPDKGTGLGLAMAKDIMKKHGGEIWFESRVDVGTTFHILVRTGTPGIHNEYINVQNLELPRILNIMLVEDRDDSRDIISGFIESFGYSPKVFTQSPEALSAYAQSPKRFDVLLTDYAMPEMNGIELARECKAINPDFPVILFSGNIQKDPCSQYIEKFIPKPFSPMELKNSLLYVLQQRN